MIVVLFLVFVVVNRSGSEQQCCEQNELKHKIIVDLCPVNLNRKMRLLYPINCQ